MSPIAEARRRYRRYPAEISATLLRIVFFVLFLFSLQNFDLLYCSFNKSCFTTRSTVSPILSYLNVFPQLFCKFFSPFSFRTSSTLLQQPYFDSFQRIVKCKRPSFKYCNNDVSTMLSKPLRKYQLFYCQQLNLQVVAMSRCYKFNVYSVLIVRPEIADFSLDTVQVFESISPLNVVQQNTCSASAFLVFYRQRSHAYSAGAYRTGQSRSLNG